MRYTPILCTLCAALLLTSCGTHQTYSRPEVETDSLFGPEAAGLQDTAGIAALSWRELFADKKLQTLIDSGLARNADLRIAALKVTEAEATLRASRLAHLPSLSFAPQGQLGGFDGHTAPETYSLALSAEWELDIAGRLTNQKRGAAASLGMSRAYRQAVQTQLVATIANSYYNLLMLDAQFDISRRTLDSWTETLRTLKVRKNVGESTEAAVAQAEANMLAVEGSLLTLRKQIREQENSLSTLLGTAPHPIERTSLAGQVFPDSLSTGIPLRLLDNRPDIRQAEYDLKRAFYATRTARAAFYPQVTLSGTLGWSNTDGSAIANPGRWLWNAVGSLAQPLFNRGKNTANLRIAKAQQEEALTSFRQKLWQAGAEVNNALTQWQTAQGRLDVDRRQIAALQAAVRGTRLLMEHSDGASYLEVLTAQQALLQAELTEAQDMFGKIQGVINLYHALGGGLR